MAFSLKSKFFQLSMPYCAFAVTEKTRSNAKRQQEERICRGTEIMRPPNEFSQRCRALCRPDLCLPGPCFQLRPTVPTGDVVLALATSVLSQSLRQRDRLDRVHQVQACPSRAGETPSRFACPSELSVSPRHRASSP